MIQLPSCPSEAGPARDEFAWNGGCHCAPVWRDTGGGPIPRATAQALLRATGLPFAELRHMGATLPDLSDACLRTRTIARRRLVLVLGRAALDRDEELVWSGDDVQVARARRRGEAELAAHGL